MEFIVHNLKFIFLAGFLVVLAFTVIKYHLKIKTFLLEVKAELGKVSWSTRQELIGSTAAVILVTAILAVFIGIIDLALSRGLSLVFK